jgi:ABC-type multidrug transport system ATPase subunit
MISVQDVRKAYGPVRVLDGISFEANPGELVLLLGANGAGKSTLLRCLLGLVGYRGRIAIAGFDPLRQGVEARRRTGYMPQGPALHLDLTVAETLWFHCGLRGAPVEPARRLLDEVELADKIDARVGELSGGMRQRLQFALALIGDPPVLLLDEPTASLDDWSRELLVRRARSLADRGRIVLLSTHARGDVVGLADRALLLRDGRASWLDRGAWSRPAGSDHTAPSTIVLPGRTLQDPAPATVLGGAVSAVALETAP